MKNKMYKQYKKNIGIKNNDIWCSYFKIAKDTEKSYSSGRLDIPMKIENSIIELAKERQKCVKLLLKLIILSFPQDKVNLHNETNNISVELVNSNKPITFINEGKDHFLHDIYSFIGPGNIKNILIYYPKNSNFNWVHWRSEPNQKLGIKNYQNEITEELLLKLVA